MYDVYSEACFSQKKEFTNGLNMGLPQQAWIKVIVHGVETYWLSRKESVLDTTISKEGHTETIFWDIKGAMTIGFLEKSAAVNNASHCQL